MDFVNTFGLFVDPVNDVEGHEEAEYDFNAGAELFSAQRFAEEFADAVDPDKDIDAESDNGKDDEKNNAEGIVLFTVDRRGRSGFCRFAGTRRNAGTGSLGAGRYGDAVAAEDTETRNGQQHGFKERNKEIRSGEVAADQRGQQVEKKDHCRQDQKSQGEFLHGNLVFDKARRGGERPAQGGDQAQQN